MYYYPHVPHEVGLMSMKKIMEEYRREYKEEGKQAVSIDDLVDLARFILENNYFEFDGGIYKQKLGTAIGTKFAPAFANIFMSELECRMLSEYHLDPWVWWRFLDDVFLKWQHGKEALLEFLDYVNSFHETITTPGNGLKKNCHIWMFWFQLRIIGYLLMFIVNQPTHITI